MEAALFFLDLMVVSYCCWVIFKQRKRPSGETINLGILAIKEPKQKSRN